MEAMGGRISCLERAREYARVYGWLPRAEARDRIGCVPRVRLVPGYTWVRLYRARYTYKSPRVLYWLVRDDMLSTWSRAYLHIVKGELVERYGRLPTRGPLAAMLGRFLSPANVIPHVVEALREDMKPPRRLTHEELREIPDW